MEKLKEKTAQIDTSKVIPGCFSQQSVQNIGIVSVLSPSIFHHKCTHTLEMPLHVTSSSSDLECPDTVVTSYPAQLTHYDSPHFFLVRSEDANCREPSKVASHGSPPASTHRSRSTPCKGAGACKPAGQESFQGIARFCYTLCPISHRSKKAWRYFMRQTL